MAQSVTIIGDRRPEQQQNVQLSPPEVAVARPRPRRKDWAFTALGLGAIFAICYFAEEILVVILISVLLAFILAPVADIVGKLHMPRPMAAGISVLLLLTALAGIGYLGFNEASNLIQQLPKYTGKIRQDAAK